jgi:uncharacterized protein (TIGR04255 family)
MANPETLAHAPITEALLDIQVRFPEDFEYESLASFQDTIKDRYPTRQVRMKWSAELKVERGELEAHREGGPAGYLFLSPDGLQAAQARIDGFSFSRLKPYEDWSRFIAEAKPLWALYASLFSPSTISRIGLRYINRIEFPEAITDFKDYFLTTPEIAPGLPQGLANFFMRLEVPFIEFGALAIITQTIQGPADPALVFDIDVVYPRIVSPTSEDLWGIVENLREIKDQIFFKSMTEKSVELFR